MKLYLFCFLIMICVLSLCFISIATVSSITCNIEHNVICAEYLFEEGQFEDGCRIIATAIKNWENKSVVLGIMLSQSPVDNVKTELSRSLAYAENENKEELFASLATLKCLLNQIKAAEYPYLMNIL